MTAKKLSRQEEEIIRGSCRQIRARKVLVWVVTDEEKRALRLIASAAKTTGKEVRLWRSTSGIVDRKGKVFDGTASPIDAINFAMRESGSCAYVFLDLHQFMTVHAGMRGAVLVRKLKDASHTLSLSGSNIFVITSDPTPPKELKDFVYIEDIPLPDSETIEVNLIRPLIRTGLSQLGEADVHTLADHLVGGTLQQAEDILAREISRLGKLTMDSLPAIRAARKDLIRGVCGLEYIELDEDLVKVGGMARVQKWLHSVKSAFTEEGRKRGLEPASGVLLVGPPGTGKSLLAKSCARIFGFALFRMDVGSLFNKYLGETEANMRRLQRTLEAFPRVVVWLDEAEKAWATGSGELDGGVSLRLLGDFLTWGQERRRGSLFFAATANDVSALRPETIRVDRLFDAIYMVDLPSLKERKVIWEIHLSRRQRKLSDSDMQLLAERSKGFTGAEINAVVRSALYKAFEANQDLRTEHLLAALEEVQPISRTMPEKIEEIREWARGKALPAGDEEND